ncbi:hypothetical protein ACO0LF_20145 [Undibacterium sp. Di27W]|uniref:hypothetical protein n=1 Tax=Undibacterium sp. Di27W TaxID=3413036 RepID=UPI003BF22A0B
MGPTKIMIIRHAEKPGTYGSNTLSGVNLLGASDNQSLVTLGWERAGGIGNLFCPSNGQLLSAELAIPNVIYAANPATVNHKEPSQRPYQTISALTAKLNLTPNTSFDKSQYKHSDGMVADVLAQSGTVLISWQHEDIWQGPGQDSIVNELLKKTNTTSLSNLPAEPWPGSRYDMVFVLDRPSGTGVFTAFTQVPQMLLAGDSSELFK